MGQLEKQAYTIELNEAQHAFLEAMAKQHDLRDAGKAVRCLIEFAMQEQGEQDRIFGEIRCSHC